MDTAEFWLEDLPWQAVPADVTLCCPRCGCLQFSISRAIYGIKLACWECPTFIGIRNAVSA